MDNWILQQSNNLRSRQLNPCDHLYWKSRGLPERPDDWRDRVYGENFPKNEQQCYSENETGYGSYEGNGTVDYYGDEEYEYYSDENDDDDSDEDDSDEEDGSEEDESEEYDYESALRSNQNNPNNDEFWKLRGWPCRPADWKEKIYGNQRSA